MTDESNHLCFVFLLVGGLGYKTREVLPIIFVTKPSEKNEKSQNVFNCKLNKN